MTVCLLFACFNNNLNIVFRFLAQLIGFVPSCDKAGSMSAEEK